jgi:hypothetical protein
VTESRGVVRNTCLTYIEYLSRCNPDQGPTIEQYSEAIERYPRLSV